MKWWHKDLAVAGTVLLLYLLAFGPAERLVFNRPDNGAALIPTLVTVIYFPVYAAIDMCHPLEEISIRYLQMWDVNIVDPDVDSDPNPGN